MGTGRMASWQARCLIVVLESATQVIVSWNSVGTNEASDATRTRRQRHDLECTPGAIEAEGREFESLRARHLLPPRNAYTTRTPSAKFGTLVTSGTIDVFVSSKPMSVRHAISPITDLSSLILRCEQADEVGHFMQ
jgi:hypothetical protein